MVICFCYELIPLQSHSRLILGTGYSGDAAQEELQKIMDYKVLRGLDRSQSATGLIEATYELLGAGNSNIFYFPLIFGELLIFRMG